MKRGATPYSSRPLRAENFVADLSFQTGAFPLIHAGHQKVPLVQ
jgi:hypothetical protein